MANVAIHNVVDEVRGVQLGDKRLDRRLRQIAGALQERPDASFPQAMGDDASTEAFYRFVANDRARWDKILRGHIDATHRRAEDRSTILAVHDSSLMQFKGEELRDGLFRSSAGKSGFLAHACLAVGADGSRCPLGLLGMIPVVRPQFGAPRDGPGAVYDNEARRWLDLVALVEDELPEDTQAVHVMDREGDAYELLDGMTLLGVDYVVRLAQDRRVMTDAGPNLLSAVMAAAPIKLTRTVQLSRRTDRKRPPATRKTHPQRDERSAKLSVRAAAVTILQPPTAAGHFDRLHVNVVFVEEVDPPEGETPVRWRLVTTSPIDTPAQVEAIVDIYRARWLIEEFFKALKTGCAFEKRQLESLDHLLVAFSLLAPLAWRLLTLRWLSRHDPDRCATAVFTVQQLALLRQLDNTRRQRLSQQPTVREAMFAIARLGGFLKQNGEPGWEILGRGLIRFHDLYRGFALASGLAADAADADEAGGAEM